MFTPRSLTSLKMCISPITMPNSHKKGFTRFDRLGFLYDQSSYRLAIPCGHCPQCIAMKQIGLVERVQMMSLAGYMYFGFLSYKNSFLPKVEVNGYKLAYAKREDIARMIHNLENCKYIDRKISFLYVSELGGERSRPHFHFLMCMEKRPSDDYLTPYQYESMLHDLCLKYWSLNVGSSRSPHFLPLCDPIEYYQNGQRKGTFGFHYVVPQLTESGVSDTAWYCLKYMMKPNDHEVRRQQALRLNLEPEDYEEIWSVIRSRWDSSIAFGYGFDRNHVHYSIKDHMRSCVQRSLQSNLEYPKYFNPDDGSQWPLGRFLFNKFVSTGDLLEFYYKNDSPDKSLDNYRERQSLSDSALLNILDNYKKNLFKTQLPTYDVIDD